MSTFFKALERAEQERALRRATTPSEPTTAPGPAAPPPDAVPAQAPPSVFRSPRPVAAKPAHPAGSAEHAEQLDERPAELDDHLVSLVAPSSFEAEQYRELRHAIEQLHRSAKLSVVAVSSPLVADGKTTTAINLAGALAQAPNARILLIDADLRAPNLAARLGIGEHAAPGFVDVILDTSLTLEAVTQDQRHLNLSVITAGRRSSSPYEVLKSPRVGELFAEARRTFDFVIVDTTPLVTVPDGRIFGEFVDGFLIVVAAHRTPRKLLEEAFNLMEPSKILGLVFNGDDRHLSKDSYGLYSSSRKWSSSKRRARAIDE
jgi:capsular exopolysaccharide synthesis family protein